jgi:hypothetical protein
MTVDEVLAEVRKLGLPRRDEAAVLITADRDGGHRDKVVDASALAAVIFDETTAESIAAQVRGCDLISPAQRPFLRLRSAPG